MQHLNENIFVQLTYDIAEKCLFWTYTGEECYIKEYGRWRSFATFLRRWNFQLKEDYSIVLKKIKSRKRVGDISSRA